MIDYSLSCYNNNISIQQSYHNYPFHSSHNNNFMRVHKPKNKPTNPEWLVDSSMQHPLKGKRHYWNSLRKDYGVCQSTDRYHNYQLDEYESRRRHSIVDAYRYENQTEPVEYYSSNAKIDISGRMEEYKRDKPKLDLISNNIEIKLPAINKNKRFETQIVEQLNSAKPIKLRNTQDKGSRNLPERVKTQVGTYSERDRRVRYSPTYVCSFNNPLPTFKLFNQGASKRTIYQYGYAEERS